MTGMTRWMSSSTFTLLTVGVTSLMPQMADLAQPEVLDLFCSWCAAFEHHLAKQALQDIQLTMIR